MKQDCLLPVSAFTPDKWTGLKDPFPLWGEAQRQPEPAE